MAAADKNDAGQAELQNMGGGGSAGGAVVPAATGRGRRDHVPVYIPTFEEGLLDEAPREKRFLDFLRAAPSRDWFLKLGLSGKFSASALFRRNSSSAHHRRSPGAAGDQLPTASPGTTIWRRRFRVTFVRKVNWAALVEHAKNWLRNPGNMAFLIWLAAVAAVLFIMLLVVTGLLNGALPRSSQRKQWVEVSSQILNALFAILCLYEHPKLAHHLVQVVRWGAKDAAELRGSYSKGGAARPRERCHIALVVVLLHVTCFMQYAICALYWGFKKSNRPELPVNVFMGVGIAAPVVAGLYTLCGPLAWKVEADSEGLESRRRREEEAAEEDKRRAAQGLPRRVVVSRPRWVGGLFDCWDDVTVAYLSFFCTFCVFGWNMERLGFGNMYVHIFTFLLFVVAPFWVFNVAGLSIDDAGWREFLGAVGILLCFLGLLYGGFWRIQMRRKFKLPPNRFCCGYPNITDCAQWLFCWPCSLAQEVRTANFYDVEEGSFCSKHNSSTVAVAPPLPEEEEDAAAAEDQPAAPAGSSRRPGLLHPLPREGWSAAPAEVLSPYEARIAIALTGASPAAAAKDLVAAAAQNRAGSPRVENNADDAMAAPVPPVLTRVEDDSNRSIGQSADQMC